MQISAKQWIARSRNSLVFYENKLPYKERQFNHVFQLADYFGPMIGARTHVKIADLGAGMFSTTGSTWPTAQVELYPSDILAREYYDILKKHHVTRLFRVEYQNMEALPYPDGMFDIVHCANAIDHCHDPALALREMNRVCKQDGYIHLRHFVENGAFQQYGGTHLWNLTPTGDGDCSFWKPNGSKFLLSNYFANFTVTLERLGAKEMPAVICTIRKGQ